MGAGTAGLIAANRALEKGLNVLVFEKMDIPGGAHAYDLQRRHGGRL